MIKKIYKYCVSEKRRIALRMGLRRSFSFLYAGSRYTCNCCGRHFRCFLTKGHQPRKNAACPYCGSLERTRLLLFFLQRETPLFTNPLRLLHIAPEEGLKKIFQKIPTLHYVDGDINPANASTVVDLTQMNFPAESFDMVICSHVLGHIPQEAKALNELYRVLAKGGELLVLSLMDLKASKTLESPGIQTPQARLKQYGEPDLCRLYGNDIEKRLSQAGFEVNRIDYRETLGADLCEKYRLGDGYREIIFRCQKK